MSGPRTLRLTDKRNQRVFAYCDLDRATRGLYTFAARRRSAGRGAHCPHGSSGTIDSRHARHRLGVPLPQRLNDRLQRSEEACALPVRVRARLTPGLPRLDLEIEVDNRAEDHRLQVLFPGGRPTSEALSDGAFEIIARATAPRSGAAEWAEQPVPEFPMRDFVADRPIDGLMVCTRGLREASVSPEGMILHAAALLRLAVARRPGDAQGRRRAGDGDPRRSGARCTPLRT
jgi:hypothetical protein